MCLNGDVVGESTATTKIISENESLRKLEEIQVSGNIYVIRTVQLAFQCFVVSRTAIEAAPSCIFEGTTWMYVMEDDTSVSLDNQGKNINDFALLVTDLGVTIRDGLSRCSTVNTKGNPRQVNIHPITSYIRL